MISEQGKLWEREYKNPSLVSLGEKPQAEMTRFLRFYKKEADKNLERKSVLDLGSGVGKNTNYFAEQGMTATGIEISPTAVSISKERAKQIGVNPTYITQSIGEPFPLRDSSFDIAIDFLTSNSLNEKERKSYISEAARVLNKNGILFFKLLAKEGDQHVKILLKKFPGKEKDTYILPEVGIQEHVLTREEIKDLYESYFSILKLERKVNYIKMNGRNYKRQFWIGYLRKK